ncbi:MAG: cyclic nucleotide-regulated FAD-dependent pyridine nucleotide-disulfide oxidoreductase [Rhodospirillales bacterium]|nr:cyclic nucleotide-regulated FAD-dependent pyridine nucleotide-disulfide oxidoreductase [Rhodospirillales bacterium]
MTSNSSPGSSQPNSHQAGAVVAPPLMPRHDQTFPTLTAVEIARIRRFGTLRRFADGERLFEAGKPGAGMFVMLAGHVAVTQRDGLGHVTPVVEEGPGQFLAELSQLSGRASLVDVTAEGAVEALLIPPEQLRALLVAEADLGERMMRAFILRRVSLIESGGSGPVLIGDDSSGGMARLQNFLRRNGYPHHLLDPDRDFEAQSLVARLAPSLEEMPLVVCPDGTVLRNPDESQLARQLDMTAGAGRKPLYDVAIVGAGPAGLATAVYAASEGLSVIVLDARAYGGQAGASARIENYLGFPTGISGAALAGRAYSQAQKFGAEIMIPVEATRLDCGRADGSLSVELRGGQRIRARSVVVAGGARYRRPAIRELARFEGRGVWYWASPIEARLCVAEEVILVGGGNSAGQAAVFLAGFARRVRMMVRSDGLAASMSRYLIDRIEATPNIDVMPLTEVVALDGPTGHGLEEVRWRDRRSGVETVDAIRHVFLFAGADPATGWLADCGVALDKSGFVVTGEGGARPLESGVRGVFAVGDVRSGSVKRVGGAIGEGAQVVQALHLFLADHAAALAAADSGKEA